ncbi:hypothetical protein CPB97_000701 [Podila verticillata]|nr:hypothetical protein CPB97_000701 [Podila verticillata]
MATLPGSSVLLAMVRQLNDKDLKAEAEPPDTNLPEPRPDMTPEIHAIVDKEFPDVFLAKLPKGLPPDRGDAMHIDTDPTADPP